MTLWEPSLVEMFYKCVKNCLIKKVVHNADAKNYIWMRNKKQISTQFNDPTLNGTLNCEKILSNYGDWLLNY